MKIFALLLTLCFGVSSGYANDGEAYKVKAKIYDNRNNMTATPKIDALPLKKSFISTDLYQIEFLVKPINDSTVLLETEIQLGSDKASRSFEISLGDEKYIDINDKKISVLVQKRAVS